MKQLGTAIKLFKELVKYDKLYYIEPTNPNEIAELTIKEVRKSTDVNHIVIVYFKSDDALKAVQDMIEEDKKLHSITKDFNLLPNASLDDAPVGKLVVPKNASHCLTMTMPPSVYYTNKKALEKWMGK